MDPINLCAPTAHCSPYQSTPNTEIHEKQKLEPQNKTQAICSVENCKIFGVHDAESMQYYPGPKIYTKSTNPYENPLGSPVGMIASNINFKTEAKPLDLALARYAAYLKAFACLHLNPVITWTSSLLDDIIRDGLALCSASEKEENKLDSPDDIYRGNEKRIQREFEMSDYKFHIELLRPFKLPATGEAGGTGDTYNTGDISLQDLKNALKYFFRQHKHCLLAMGTTYTMIWPHRGVYFILDVCGRKLNNFYADREKGMAMLLCLKTLENVRHLLMDLTNVGKVDSCTLRELKLVKVIKPSGGVIQRDYGVRVQQFEIVNDNYAYLKASLHLSLNKTELLRNRSALPAGIVAIVASKIDHPATWNMKILDKILCFAVSFCQTCWTKYITMDANNVEEFPSHFYMGQFRVNIKLHPRMYVGIWHCVPNYKRSELALAIEKALKGADEKVLIQINYQIYAIWKKQDFMYLFDPYRHRILGQAGDLEIYEEMVKSSTLRMFRCFDILMNTFNHILLDSNRTSQFFIHRIQIKNIHFRDKKDEQEINLDEDVEVKSLNEHICFEESENLCQQRLGEVSDYEDDELCSDVDELELKTSSSEEDEGLEEEETGAAGAEEEEIEGVESTSSSEEDAVKTKGKIAKKRGGKKKAKGGKTVVVNKKSKNTSKANSRNKAGETLEDNDASYKGLGEVENKAVNKNPEALGNKKQQKDIEANFSVRGTKDSDNQKENKNEDVYTSLAYQPKKEDNYGPKDITTMTEKKPPETIDQKVLETTKKEDVEKNKERPIERNKSKDVHEGKEESQNQNLVKDKPTVLTEKNVINGIEKSNSPVESVQPQRPKYTHQVDGSEADDENEDDFFRNIYRYCTPAKSNRYPGYFKQPLDLAVIGSENGSYQSLCKLLHAGFRRADRILALTPCGNFVVFRTMSDGQNEQDSTHYYIFNGCTCNINRFRHLDLSLGTAGLLCFQHMHDVIEYMRHIRQIRLRENKRLCRHLTANEICQEYSQ